MDRERRSRRTTHVEPAPRRVHRAADPVQTARVPLVDVADDDHRHEGSADDQRGTGELAEDDGDRPDERHLDIEDEIEQRDDVEPEIELDPR